MPTVFLCSGLPDPEACEGLEGRPLILDATLLLCEVRPASEPGPRPH